MNINLFEKMDKINSMEKPAEKKLDEESLASRLSGMSIQALQDEWNKIGIGPKDKVPSGRKTLIKDIQAEIENRQTAKEEK